MDTTKTDKRQGFFAAQDRRIATEKTTNSPKSGAAIVLPKTSEDFQPDCERCGDRGYVNNFRIQTNGESVIGFIYWKDEPDFFRRHPDATHVGVQSCECKLVKRIENLFGYAGIPNRRQHCTWEWFDGQSQDLQEGKETARQFAAELSRGGRFEHPHSGGLFIRGRTGMGKSGLAACIARERIAQGQAVLWIDLNEFLNECYRAQERMFAREQGDDSSAANPFQFVDAVANAPFLILDDFGDSKRKGEVTQYQRDKVYDVIRARYENEMSSVITSNLSQEQLYSQFGSRIADRIGEAWRYCEMTGLPLRFVEAEQEDQA